MIQQVLKSNKFERLIDREGKEKLSIDPCRTPAIKASHDVYRIRYNGQDGYFKQCNPQKVRDFSGILAYEKVAGILGLADLVPHSRICKAEIEGQGVVYGLYQEKALGYDIWNLSTAERREKITPEFQRIVSNFRLLDIICHEADHSLNNYYPIENEFRKFISVSSFDNGGVGSFCKKAEISFCTYYGCSPMFDKLDNITYPYLDKAFVERLRSLSFAGIVKVLNKDINLIEIFYVWKRIIRIRNSIKKGLRNNTVKLMDAWEWSVETINRELSGDFGNTYIYSLVNDWGSKEGHSLNPRINGSDLHMKEKGG